MQHYAIQRAEAHRRSGDMDVADIGHGILDALLDNRAEIRQQEAPERQEREWEFMRRQAAHIGARDSEAGNMNNDGSPATVDAVLRRATLAEQLPENLDRRAPGHAEG